jgi:hypothetical protein
VGVGVSARADWAVPSLVSVSLLLLKLVGNSNAVGFVLCSFAA